MPVNNALTPEGSNALGAAFGYYPQLKKYRQFNDPSASAEMPLQFLRGRLASTFGAPSDILNTFRSPMPMEMYGQTDYAPQQQVPYGSQELMRTLPLAPASPAGQLAGNVGSVVPLSPAEILQAARVARQAALAGGRAGKQGLGMLGQEVNATLLGERPKTFLGAITPKPMYAVEPNANLLAQSVMKPMAEVSPLGFYSAVEQQALNIPRKQGTGASFLNDLSKGQDVKKYEIEAMGLEDFLKGKTNVTRQEVQDFIKNNKINVEERQLGGTITEDPIGIAKREEVFNKYEPQIQDLYRRIDKPEYVVYDPETNKVLKSYTNYDDALLDNLDPLGAFGKTKTALRPKENSRQLQQQITDLQNIRDAEANAAYVVPEVTPTKYQKFQLPGGENYRELLLTLPSSKTSMDDFLQMAGKKYGGDTPRNQWSPQDNAMYEKLLQEEKTPTKAEYRSSHFPDPNILAHMRVNDRVDAEGKKMLLIEEVQSDWHQAGREKGYNDPKAQAQAQEKIIELKEEHRILGQLKELTTNEAERNAISQKRFDLMNQAQELSKVGQSGVPDAPFKDTWHQLALKRAIKEAVDKGYDRIGLTTGAQQAERYDLSKQINKIDYRRSSNNTFELGVVGKNGESVDLPKRFYTAEELPSVLGKEVADKIIKGEGQGGGGRMTLSGLDLQVGGEGMKKYYDEVYPNFLNKFGKKYGAQVGETRVKTGRGVQGGEPVRYLDITPEMRDAVKKGQPLASITNHLANAMA